MKKLIIILLLATGVAHGQSTVQLDRVMAEKLSKLPLACIGQEFPNKTSHVAITAVDGRLLPSELHPVFYGCLDWHSSVHGHWMLVRLLKTVSQLGNEAEIKAQLNKTFTRQNMEAEAAYFTKYDQADSYERTYGWAWLLKLDEELAGWDNADAKRWHANLQPLTQQILKLWKAYLPKQTYPSRSGMHGNTAFALVFALDWARAMKDAHFERQIIQKAKDFYLASKKTPAYLEPDGSDFFSPSLEIADLMRRILPSREFTQWINKFYEKRSIARISEMPIISDLNDYLTVHLVGLSFTRAWCMKGIASHLPARHKWKAHFEQTANKFLTNALPIIFKSNYGGDHWLGSFAVYALE